MPDAPTGISDAPTDPGNVLDLGTIRSPDGWFLRRSAEQRPFDPRPAGDEQTWQFCSTFRDSPPTLHDAVLELVRNAREKVFVTSFILGDDDLIEELVATADRLGGGVYVISELSERSLRRGLAELADREVRGKDLGQKVEAEKKRFMSLTKRGIAVRGHENCHAKFVVVDDSVAWVGSANLETRAFTKVGEVGVITTDACSVRNLARRFARMWLSGCTYELPSTADAYHVDEYTPRPVSFLVDPGGVGEQPGLVWTDASERTVLDNAHHVIGQARRDLVLATFSFQGMNARPDLLLVPVADAIDRGVNVTMFVRAMNRRDGHRRDAGLLASLGVRVVADELNHAKAAVADDTHGALFSANWDAEHGLDAGSGIEVGARLDGTPALAELVRYLRHAIATATHEFVHAPTGRQLDHSLDAPWQQLWPLEHELTVSASSADWHALSTASPNAPVLWTRTEHEPVELLAGRERFRLRPVGADSYRLERLVAGGPASEELSRWWDTREPLSGSRGYCPATLARSASGP